MTTTMSNERMNVAISITDVRSKWGWFVALGILAAIAGTVALGNLMLATAVSVYVVGAMMLIAGIAHVVESFGVRSWGGFFFWLLSGLLYTVAAFIVFYNPLMGAVWITLTVGVLLLVSGIARIVSGFQFRRRPGWSWLVVSGLVSVLAGVVVALSWPDSSLWLLGLALGLDLLFQGAFAIAFGLAVRIAGAGAPSHA